MTTATVINSRPTTGFAVNYLAGSEWARNGLRPFRTYRDLGVAAATGRVWRAHQIRIIDAAGANTGWHCHDCLCQFVYVLRECVRFMVLELNARPGLTIQLANRQGLRASMEALAIADLEGCSLDERLALGRRLARGESL